MTKNVTAKINRSPLATIVSYNGILPKLAESVFLACGARVIGDVVMEENCSVWFNTVVRGDVHSIYIGENTNIQDNAIIHCTFQKFPTKIGKNVSIGHLATIHGCTVENGCLIGMGAIIMDDAVIGEESIVGAGSIVTQGIKIPPRSLVIGSPAKVIRQVTDKEYEAILATTFRYLEYSKGYNYSAS
jgi:gamma-carbonic anhydrase